MPKKLKPSKGTSKKTQAARTATKSAKTKKVTSVGARKAATKAKPKSSIRSKTAIHEKSKHKSAAPPERVPSRQFSGAVAALEAGIKLMYAEDYGKAVKAFNKVIADYPDEPEILASAKARQSFRPGAFAYLPRSADAY